MSRTVRVDEETYKKLTKHAGKLQENQGRPITINEAINDLTKTKPNKITDLAGTWNITDKEHQKIQDALNEGWKKWKPQ